MSDSTLLTHLWLLDWFGHIIDHDPIRDELIRRPFTPYNYPDLFALAPLPLKLPATAMLRKRSTLPRAFPDLEMVDAGDNLIGLRVKERNSWFSINPRNELTHFNAASLMGWEKFSPLTIEMFNGLSALIDRNSSAILDSEGKECGPAHFRPEGDNVVVLQDFQFCTGRNARQLHAIGELTPGNETTITLQGWGADTQQTFTIRCLKESKS
ncbi:hypothetical protein GS501_08790 [Saccharibacter sp. 17.LH.SD]|uniref:hypothetical protein n=1 Tax=Saccharibacter sp. 17.LH.SD TaxID=2689393 RepID=UPI00136B1EAB|nr:hypothetical protein [Saccharibacter sp. 17.LH.SD]MXV45131.1 hypothetical protein [Saccharibacter sp. 17.LH.SD]